MLRPYVFAHTPDIGMPYDPDKHHRRSLRLPGYDYTQVGAYFVTLCTAGRTSLLGQIDAGTLDLSMYGRIVEQCWCDLPQHFPNVSLDAFVVMPNHLHGILILTGQALQHPHPPHSRLPVPHGTQPGSLGAVIQNFKAVSTRKVNGARRTRGEPVWQRNYYERIVRNANELDRIRQYI